MNAPDPKVLLAPTRRATDAAYTVSVRALCEFTAKVGDLDLRFTPSPTAEEGIAGHREVQSHRPETYRREVPVRGEYANLVVRGRADGFDAAQAVVEEIKTCLGDMAKIPGNHRALHWAQAKVYGALLCREFDLPGITVSLVYFDVREQRELPRIDEYHSADALDEFFRTLCERFLAWAKAEAEHRVARDASIETLSFPHTRFRAGQREFAKSVFNAARTRACLLAQAPTGVGKTLAAIFPMLKACPREAIDKVCFLTAKNSGKALALSTLDTLQRAHPALRLRSIELTAREKSCEHPDKACHPESCPLARGFYDRLPAARASAADRGVLTQDVLREIALTHSVCPYYLAQEMTRWCDVVIADYNLYFDRRALLYDLAQENGWRLALLVDEAHNLLERARSMYSASLAGSRLRDVLAGAPHRVVSSVQRLRKQWHRIAREATAPYRVLPAPPDALQTAVQDVTGTLSEHFADEPTVSNTVLLDLYFDALAFERAIDTFGTHSMFDVRVHEHALAGNSFADAGLPLSRAGASATDSPALLDSPVHGDDVDMAVHNVVPAPFLGPRFEAAHCAVLFSATLSPWQFYIDMLGLPASTACTDIASPFAPDQLLVRVVAEVSTRYRQRDRSIVPIANLVGHEYARNPGNYIVFLSSFEYLERIAEEFASRHPDIPAWRQTRPMSETERAQFLRRFLPDGCGVGFAVLGGVFAEGIDLVGTRLIGVFVATLGLPQVNEVNEEIRRRLDVVFGKGYDYAYLYPGLRKVVQAAGRVIRSETDRGSVFLIDDRYSRAEIRALLPRWWRIDGDRDAGTVLDQATAFDA